MRRTSHLVTAIAGIAVAIIMLWPAQAHAQRRFAVRGSVVFVGGYFYDPFYGPYPWWSPYSYPYPYYPTFDERAQVRLLVTPKQAAVYVDGFYAGIVDDFDGFFQRLPLPPADHEIVLYLQGYRTVHERVYLMPDATFKLQYKMERLPAGETSEPPPAAPTIPPPPPGSAMMPHTPRAGTAFGPPPTNFAPPPQPPPPPSTSIVPAVQSHDFGTLAIRVQPVDAEVTIDGERWNGSDGERLVIQVGEGTHHVEIQKSGFRPFTGDVAIRRGETTPLNVSLSGEKPR